MEASAWGIVPDPDAISSATAQYPGDSFDDYRMELGGKAVNSAISFDDETPSPLFTTPSDSATDAVGNAPGLNRGKGMSTDSSASEWDYLWRNASRIPISAIPEPTTASLLLLGALAAGLRRTRKRAK